jgi:hypothetical protein
VRALPIDAPCCPLLLNTAPPTPGPTHAAYCTSVDQSNSNFELAEDETTSTATKACFVISADRGCDDASGMCCGESAPYVYSIYMEVPSSCGTRANVRGMRVRERGGRAGEQWQAGQKWGLRSLGAVQLANHATATALITCCLSVCALICYLPHTLS